MKVIGSVADQGTGDTEAPSIPQNLSATPINRTRIDLAWSASTDNVGVAGYQVFRDGLPIDTTTEVSYSDTGLNASTQYSYTVAAFDSAGNTSDESGAELATTLANSPPTWSAIPDQDLIVGNSFNLDLDDFISDVDFDTIVYTQILGTLPTGLSFNGTTGVISGTPTTSGESALMTFRADDGFDTADTSFTFTSYDADVTAPPVPTGLAASDITDNSITLNWTASVDAQGSANEFVSGTQDYRLYRDAGLLATITSPTVSYQDTGLSASTTYSYTISARDSELNESAQSTAITPQTLSTSPAVITDWLDATSGVIEIMGPGAVYLHATGTTLTQGDWLNAKVEWDFGDPSGTYNTLRGFSAAHFYDTEPVSNTDYTVTLTITQQDGTQLTAQRTVRVTPNTRAIHYINPNTGTASPTDPSDPNDPWDTLPNAWAGTSGNDLDFRLSAGDNHTCGSMSSGTRTGIIIRSGTGGTKANVSGLDVNIDGLGMKDLHWLNRGASPSAIEMADGGDDVWLVDLTSADNRASVMISNEGNVGMLIQNVQADDDGTNGVIYAAGSMLTTLGVDIRHYPSVGGERPYRGLGNHLLVHDSLFETTLKTALTFTGDSLLVQQQFCYASESTFTHETGDDGGNAVQIGHNSGASNYLGIANVVIERCRVNGNLYVQYGNTIQADDVVLRNNIVDDGSIALTTSLSVAETATDIRAYRNTVYGEDAQMTQHFITNLTDADNITISGNLSAGYNKTGTFSDEVLTIQGLAAQTLDISNNVWQIPDDGVNDSVRINGGSRISVATMDSTYSWASGNINKSITLDANYRPTDTSDADILFAPEADMAQFAEDYYGNPRSGGTWIAGAVDEAP